MGYCTIQDLEGYFLNKSFKCGDYLTTGKAQVFIDTDAAIINAQISAKYSLPITNTNDLMILKAINAGMTVGTIDDIFREKTEDGSFERGRNTRKEALDMLKLIRNGDLLLDGTQKTSVIKFNTLTSDDETDVTKRFKVSNIDSL